MNKKLIAAAAALIMLFTACGGNNAPADTSAAETQAQTEAATEQQSETESESVTEAEEPVDEAHKAMVDRSLYSLGNTSRLKAKMEKARSGERTTVAYIGGSITEGAGGGPDGCYARLSYNYFSDTYGKDNNVKYINAGLSGTSSTLGVLRLERDVLSKKPDIVFVEFAVNDSMDETSRWAYESLVRTTLESESQPAVILIFNRLEGGYSAQAHMKEIGTHYDLPMVSVADAITPEFDEGRMTWQEYSEDYAHPTKDGHQLVCEFIANMYKEAEKAPDSGEYTVPATGKFGAPFKEPALLLPEGESDRITMTDMGCFGVHQANAPGFKKGWQFEKEGSDPLCFETKASALFVIYRRNKTETMGSFDVYVNGSKLKTVNTCQKDGWGEAFSELIIKFHEAKDMKVEIVPSEGSEDKLIQILGIGSADNPDSDW